MARKVSAVCAVVDGLCFGLVQYTRELEVLYEGVTSLSNLPCPIDLVLPLVYTQEFSSAGVTVFLPTCIVDTYHILYIIQLRDIVVQYLPLSLSSVICITYRKYICTQGYFSLGRG